MSDHCTDVAQIAVFLTHKIFRDNWPCFQHRLDGKPCPPIATTCCYPATWRIHYNYNVLCIKKLDLYFHQYCWNCSILYPHPIDLKLLPSVTFCGKTCLCLNIPASFCWCNIEIDTCLKTCHKDFCLMSCDVSSCWWYAKFFCRADMPHICACYPHLSIGLVW